MIIGDCCWKRLKVVKSVLMIELDDDNVDDDDEDYDDAADDDDDDEN